VGLKGVKQNVLIGLLPCHDTVQTNCKMGNILHQSKIRKCRAEQNFVKSCCVPCEIYACTYIQDGKHSQSLITKCMIMTLLLRDQIGLRCCFFETNLQFELTAVLLLQGFRFNFPPFNFAFSTEKGSKTNKLCSSWHQQCSWVQVTTKMC